MNLFYGVGEDVGRGKLNVAFLELGGAAHRHVFYPASFGEGRRLDSCVGTRDSDCAAGSGIGFRTFIVDGSVVRGQIAKTQASRFFPRICWAPWRIRKHQLLLCQGIFPVPIGLDAEVTTFFSTTKESISISKSTKQIRSVQCFFCQRCVWSPHASANTNLRIKQTCKAGDQEESRKIPKH